MGGMVPDALERGSRLQLQVPPAVSHSLSSHPSRVQLPGRTRGSVDGSVTGGGTIFTPDDVGILGGAQNKSTGIRGKLQELAEPFLGLTRDIQRAFKQPTLSQQQ